ncbi:MAG: prepilin-type N-terminal cleavage/methylation domain-containing protein [Planctomycetota bacterium]
MKAGGFTLVELLVASVIGSVTVLGAYVLLAQASEVGERLGETSRDRAAARLVAQEFALAVESSLLAGSTPQIIGSTEHSASSSTVTLTSVVSGHLARNPADPSNASTRMQRLTWSSGSGGHVRLRTRLLAGVTDITTPRGSRGLSEQRQWDSAADRVIAEGVDRVSVNYLDLGTGSAQWRTSLDRAAGRVLARVTVRVGSQVVERSASSRITSPLIEETP